MNSIEKTLAVVRSVSLPGHPHRLAEVAAAAGLSKTSTHRILQALLANNYAITGGDGNYAPGPALHALGVAATTQFDLVAMAQPVLTRLQEETGHTVHFAVRSGGAAVYVAKIESGLPYQMASRVGMQIQLHCTSIGKSILSALPREEVLRLLADHDETDPSAPALTGTTTLMDELDVIAGRGFAIDDEENEPNVRCVGAPVLTSSGTVLGGVSVSGLTFTFSLEDVQQAAPTVMAAAQQLSSSVGAGVVTAR